MGYGMDQAFNLILPPQDSRGDGWRSEANNLAPEDSNRHGMHAVFSSLC